MIFFKLLFVLSFVWYINAKDLVSTVTEPIGKCFVKNGDKYETIILN